MVVLRRKAGANSNSGSNANTNLPSQPRDPDTNTNAAIAVAVAEGKYRSSHRFAQRALINRFIGKLKNGDQMEIYDRKKKRKLLKKELTSAEQILNLDFRDWLGVTCPPASAEVPLELFRAVKSSSNRTALPCSSAVDCSLACERTESCHRRAVFIGDNLAA
jgi:hypothetical protein